MADHASETTIIDAPPEACFAVIVDFERYPEWASEVKKVDVIRTDDDGRGGLVAFRVAAMGRSTSYSLEYYYGSNPLRTGWRLVDGSLLTRLDGHYVFSALPDDPNRTEVLYVLDVEVADGIFPGFVKKRAESRIIRTALKDLRDRVESVTRQ